MVSNVWELLGAAAAGAVVAYACLRERGRRITARTARGNRRAPKRHAGVIKVKPEMLDQYTQLHDRCWEEVVQLMYDCNMRNFTVYLHRETCQLFHHWEYIGDDFAADMQRVAAAPISHLWWSYCEPCQVPLEADAYPPSKGGKVWWSPMVCLTHCGAWPTAWSDELYDPDFVPQNPHGKTSTSANPPPVHNRN